MSEHPKPHFSQEIIEEIRRAQYDVQKQYWPQIHSLLEPIRFELPVELAPRRQFGLPVSGTPPEPPKPPLPGQLSKILTGFAVDLFHCEFQFHSKTAPDSWRADLTARTENQVMGDVQHIEDEANGTLSRHARKDEMLSWVRQALRSISSVLVTLTSAPLTTSPALHRTPDPTARRKALVERLTLAAKGIGNKELIARIGIPRSTFYAVKGERGYVSDDKLEEIEIKLAKLQSETSPSES